MKRLVNIVQLMIVLVMFYPVYYMWDTGRVDDICAQIKPGMAKAQFMQLVDDFSVKLIGPQDVSIAGGEWHAAVVARASFSGYACEVKGIGNLVAKAEINQK